MSLTKIKEQLASRGARSIRGFSRVFRIMDDNGDKKLSRDELLYGLKDQGLEVTDADVDEIMSVCDTDGSGSLNFDEFLKGIRGIPNAFRQEYIDKAFAKFDADGSGHLTIDDLKGIYNCESHPGFQAGEVTEDEVFQEFLDQFGNTDGDLSVSKAEWNSYYAGVSASMDNDEEFGLMMTNAWKL